MGTKERRQHSFLMVIQEWSTNSSAPPIGSKLQQRPCWTQKLRLLKGVSCEMDPLEPEQIGMEPQPSCHPSGGFSEFLEICTFTTEMIFHRLKILK